MKRLPKKVLKSGLIVMRMDSPEGKALMLQGRIQEAEALARAKTIRDWKRAERRAPRDASWLKFAGKLYSLPDTRQRLQKFKRNLWQ